MLRDAINYFKDDENVYTNQQIIRHKDTFRGVIVKEWIAGNEHDVSYHNYNKILIKCCVHVYV